MYVKVLKFELNTDNSAKSLAKCTPNDSSPACRLRVYPSVFLRLRTSSTQSSSKFKHKYLILLCRNEQCQWKVLAQLAIERHETIDIVSEGKHKLSCFTRSEPGLQNTFKCVLLSFEITKYLHI
jgi:hypothetical protein